MAGADRARPAGAENLEEVFNFDDSKDCFACGTDNPAGLQMRFFRDGETIVSFLNVDRRHCGWSSILHGGIVTTILDETMSWTAHHLLKKLILTKSIHIEFSRPVPVEQDIRSVGRIKQISGPREAVLEAVITDADGRACATGTGVFALLTPALARRLRVIDEGVIRSFEVFAAEGA